MKPQAIVFLFLNCLAIASLAQAASYDILKQRISYRAVGAHQGGLFEAAQNTLEQFERARKAGVDIVEMDLRITKDGVPVVFHDEELNTLTNCQGKVRDLMAREVLDCTVNGSPAKVPSFESVLKWAQGRVVVDAEFKDSETIAPALDLVRKYNSESWTYFQVQNNWGKYQLARSLSSTVSLLFAVRNEEDFKKVLEIEDPALIIIEVSKETRDQNHLQAFKAKGYLISEDAFDFVWHKELFGAACGKAFSAGIDIPISNQTSGCVKQK